MPLGLYKRHFCFQHVIKYCSAKIDKMNLYSNKKIMIEILFQNLHFSKIPLSLY